MSLQQLRAALLTAMHGNDSRKQVKSVTLSAMTVALSVLLLYLGRLIEIADLCALALSSFFVLFALMELKPPYPVLIYAATSVLATLLARETGLLYLTFAGVYPLLKFRIDKLPRVLAYALKFLYFNAVAVGYYAVIRFLLTGGEADMGLPMLLLYFALINVTFFTYDLALRRFVRYYFVKIQPRIARFLK